MNLLLHSRDGSDLSGLLAMSSPTVMKIWNDKYVQVSNDCSDKGGASIPDHPPLNWAGNIKSE